jgi:hypothetical protein
MRFSSSWNACVSARLAVAHAGRILRRHVDGEAVGAPVGHYGVGLHAAVCLHLCAELAFDHNVGLREALGGIAARTRRVGAAHVAPLRQLAHTHRAASEALPVHGACEHERSLVSARVLDIDHERERHIVDLDQIQRRLCDLWRGRSHGGDGVANVEGGAAVSPRTAGIRVRGLDSPSDRLCDQMDGPHSRMPRGGAGIDRSDAGMRVRGAQ